MAASPRRPVSGARPRQSALRLLADRVLVHAPLRTAAEMLDLISPLSSGLVVATARPAEAVGQLREGESFDGVLLADPQAYLKYWATPDEPFLGEPGRLFGGTPAELVKEQLEAGADAALTPTGCIRAGNAAALRAALEQAARLERDDVIVSVPLEKGWLEPGLADIAVDMLSRADLPKAVFVEGQFNPPEQVGPAADSVLSERRLAAEPPATALFRRDLAALDAVAHGALAGSIGTSGNTRHFIKPGEVPLFTMPQDGEPPDQSPNILVGDLLDYMHGSKLARLFRAGAGPRCSCAVCQGTRISGFTGRSHWTAASRHDAAVWSEWLPGLRQGAAERMRFWTRLCREGAANHDVYDKMAGSPGAFPVPLPLRVWSGERT